jgi:FkbM family methyltransferase
MTSAEAEFGALAPGWFDRAVLALTNRVPDNWLGLRLAILLRRAVTMRLPYPDGALDVERWGVRLRLHPRDNGCEKNLLFTPQMYEPTELKVLAAEIAAARGAQRPFVFIDIGANVGLFSLFAAARAGTASRILAVEPELGNLRRLEFNLRANPGLPIKIAPVALSDAAGEVAIALDRRDRGGSRTTKVANGVSGAVRVRAQTLLALLTVESIDAVDVLKIDVEGAEDIVLQPFFREAPPQLWPRLIIIEDSRAEWTSDLLSTLAAKGYVLATRSKQNMIFRHMPAPGQLQAAAAIAATAAQADACNAIAG